MLLDSTLDVTFIIVATTTPSLIQFSILLYCPPLALLWCCCIVYHHDHYHQSHCYIYYCHHHSRHHYCGLRNYLHRFSHRPTTTAFPPLKLSPHSHWSLIDVAFFIVLFVIEPPFYCSCYHCKLDHH